MKEFFDKLEENYLDKIGPEFVLLVLAIIVVLYFLMWIIRKIKNAPYMEECDGNDCETVDDPQNMYWTNEKFPRLLCGKCYNNINILTSG